MKNLTLPKILEPKQDFPLVRLGSSRDGGYLIDKRLLGNDLLTFGISGDWKFEKDWKRLSKPSCRIVAFDGSIGAIKFLVDAVTSSFRVHKPDLIMRNWRVLFDYFRFLKTHTSFHRKFVIRGIADGSHETFANALQNYSLTQPVFLKMDIEGNEYELLDAIIDHRTSLIGIAIEFHNPLANIEAIKGFVSGIDMNITNVHVNNCLPKDDSKVVEPSIEISLSTQTGTGPYSGHPHRLERENDATCDPVAINFS
jgi:hypothetical protein